MDTNRSSSEDTFLPLRGRRIVITRAQAQASTFAEALEALGAEVIPAATIRIEGLADTPEMRGAAHDAARMDWCVFTSANAVDSFCEACRLEGVDADAFGAVRFAAVGPPTAARLEQAGLRCDLVPARYVAEGLLDAFDVLGGIAGQRVLLPRAEVTRPALADGLRDRGALLTEIVAYRTHSENTLPETVLALLECGTIDLVAFTSGSTANSFAALLPEERRAALLGKVRGASIGPMTSAAMREAGIAIAVEAVESTIPGLVAAMAGYFGAGKTI